MVTYKYLSRALDVHVNTAKQMLWNYKESKQGACKGVVYFVSGLVSIKTILSDFAYNQGGIKCGNRGTGFLDREGSHR